LASHQVSALEGLHTLLNHLTNTDRWGYRSTEV
jgi:hypothetical protein